jgi:hypothetical protein
LRVRELGGGLAAQHLGADEGECEKDDDSGRPVHGRDRAPNEDQHHDEHDDPERELDLVAQEWRDRAATPDGQARGAGEPRGGD